MADNTLNKITDPHTIIADDFNQFSSALAGDFVGRDAVNRAPSPDERLGTPSIPWAELHATNVFVGGALLDLENLGAGASTKNAINDGRTRTDSGQPDFIRANGGAATATLLATDTDLKYTANNVGVIITDDVVITSIQTAPTTNNTAAINNSDLSGANSTKYEGEGQGARIELDNVGQEIIDRVGQYVCLKNGTNEIMLAYVADVDDTAFTATITNVFRGFFFDSAGAPIVRETMSDNDTLTLLSGGWLFGSNNGTVFDVSYRSPIYSAVEPTSPAVDDYWFDLANQNWYRYDGTDFLEIDRLLLGMVVADGTNCIASRSFDFAKSYTDVIDMELNESPQSDEVIETAETFSKVSVYGKTLEYFSGRFSWDITSDLETGLTEQSDFLYYLYITEEGVGVISDERPYDRTADLRGFYHPYHTWRFVGVANNDSSGDFSKANSKNNNQAKVEVFTSSGEFLPLPNANNAKVTVVGAGGGTSTGGSSTFGAECSATGGGGGGSGTVGTGGAGGIGVGGDINISGQDGGNGVKIRFNNSGNDQNAVVSGLGGSSILGGGGRNAVMTEEGSSTVSISSASGNAYGAGAGGTRTTGIGIGGQPIAHGGGGGGGAAIKWISNLASRISVTIGAGGSGGGFQGVCIVEY